MTTIRTIEVDEATAVALEACAAEKEITVAQLLADWAGQAAVDAVSDEDWSIALARLAEYDRTGVSHGVDEVFAEFRDQLEEAITGRK